MCAQMAYISEYILLFLSANVDEHTRVLSCHTEYQNMPNSESEKLESECEEPISESENPSLKAKNTSNGVGILCYLISGLAINNYVAIISFCVLVCSLRRNHSVLR
jgi:hypothetical protein